MLRLSKIAFFGSILALVASVVVFAFSSGHSSAYGRVLALVASAVALGLTSFVIRFRMRLYEQSGSSPEEEKREHNRAVQKALASAGELSKHHVFLVLYGIWAGKSEYRPKSALQWSQLIASATILWIMGGLYVVVRFIAPNVTFGCLGYHPIWNMFLILGFFALMAAVTPYVGHRVAQEFPGSLNDPVDFWGKPVWMKKVKPLRKSWLFGLVVICLVEMANLSICWLFS